MFYLQPMPPRTMPPTRSTAQVPLWWKEPDPRIDKREVAERFGIAAALRGPDQKGRFVLRCELRAI